MSGWDEQKVIPKSGSFIYIKGEDEVPNLFKNIFASLKEGDVLCIDENTGMYDIETRYGSTSEKMISYNVRIELGAE